MNRRYFLKSSLVAALAAALPTVPGRAQAEASTSTTTNPTTTKEKKTMNILVLTGSPRRQGNSAILADHFIRGASEAGHNVVRFDAALKSVHPCIACNNCGMDGPCVFEDDFDFVREHILPADLVAFATPMYYFGFSAQLKAVIDRFYAINGSIHRPRKAVLLMTYANNSKRDESPMATHYEVLLDYLGWTDAGRVIAPGVWPAGAVERTNFPEQAYQLGKKL